MKTLYRRQIVEAIRAIEIRSRHRFAWLGQPSPPVPRELSGLLPDVAARKLLLRAMRARLYGSWYTTGGVTTVEGSGTGGVPDLPFVAALSAANAGTGSWEHGWVLEQARDDELLISKNGVTVRAPRSGCRVRNGGEELSLAIPSSLPALSPGFLTVVGDVDLEPGAAELVARVYFNVTSDGAARLLGLVSSALNDARVPFRFKVVNSPAGFTRCDAAVLYLTTAEFRRRRGLLRPVVEACAGELRARTPAFTKALAPGVGIAEEAGDAHGSFGMHRCALVAEGVLAAHEQKARDLSQRVEAVQRHLAVAGLDVDAPYLEKGSADGYSL